MANCLRQNVCRQFLYNYRPQVMQSVRVVSSFKRTRDIQVRDTYDSIIKEIVNQNDSLRPEQWSLLKSDILNKNRGISKVNIDATIMGYCLSDNQLDLAKDFIRYLKEFDTKPNYATVGRLLKLYYNCHQLDRLTDEDRIECSNICKELLADCPVLDPTTAECVIQGLCIGDEWKRSMRLIDDIKVISLPSIHSYSALIAKAFSEGEDNLGFIYLDEMIEFGKAPKCEVFLSYLKQCQTSSECVERIEKMLTYVGNQYLHLTKRVTDELSIILNNFEFTTTFTTVNKQGRCLNCRKFLEPVSIPPSAFEQLSASFLSNVLIRKDVFLKTTPKELDSFLKFIEKSNSFDCVVDGLNVAFSCGINKTPNQYSQLLLTVTNYLVDQNKRILILGRKHMLKWPKKYMDQIRKKADIFLTENLSQDDPFLLYATLKSGPNTDFFSRDLMRGHSHLLGHDMKKIFQRWQQQHQYSLIHAKEDGQVIVKEPLKYRICAHKTEDNWHCPIIQEYNPQLPNIIETPSSWLCITKTKNK